MALEPLMLSDTAMVLLRQYNELSSAYWTTRKALSQMISPISKEYGHATYEWFETHNQSHIISAVQWELMHEIWLLWTFRDVPIVRHLEWHLVFNPPLMTMAEKTFIPPHEYPRRNIRGITKNATDTTWFLETLDIAYQKALVARTKGGVKAVPL